MVFETLELFIQGNINEKFNFKFILPHLSVHRPHFHGRLGIFALLALTPVLAGITVLLSRFSAISLTAIFI